MLWRGVLLWFAFSALSVTARFRRRLALALLSTCPLECLSRLCPPVRLFLAPARVFLPLSFLLLPLQAALVARREAGGAGSDSGLDDDDDGAASVVTGVSTVGGMSAYSVATTTATATTTMTSASASTVGGRKAARHLAKKAERRARKAARRGRVRQGSPVEEEALCRHLLSLRPSAGALEEVGALAELLVLLGAEPDARKLQAAASETLSEADKAAAEVLSKPPPAQPGSEVAPADEFRDRVARDRAETGKIEWKWDLLRD